MEESHDLFFLSRGAEGKENETSSLVGGVILIWIFFLAKVCKPINTVFFSFFLLKRNE